MAVKKLRKTLGSFSALTRAEKQINEVLPGSERQDWKRKNYRGNEVDLIGGVSLAYLLTRGAATGGLTATEGAAQAISIGGAAALGYLDDTREARTAQLAKRPVLSKETNLDQGESSTANAATEAYDSAQAKYKGLKGHWQSLRQGEISTGVWKVLGIGASAGVSALLLQVDAKQRQRQITRLLDRGISAKSPSRRNEKRTQKRLAQLRAASTRSRYSLVDWGLDSGIIAGSANLINLFDLRPGRALKVSTLLTLPLVLAKGSEKKLARRLLWVNLLSFPTDLQEKTMLGDTGANALGAALGTAWAMQVKKKRHKLLLFTAIAGLTVLSEKVSFSKVIEKTPLLKAIDEIGRV